MHGGLPVRRKARQMLAALLIHTKNIHRKKTKKIVKIINIHYKEDASPFTNSPMSDLRKYNYANRT